DLEFVDGSDGERSRGGLIGNGNRREQGEQESILGCDHGSWNCDSEWRGRSAPAHEWAVHVIIMIFGGGWEGSQARFRIGDFGLRIGRRDRMEGGRKARGVNGGEFKKKRGAPRQRE